MFDFTVSLSMCPYFCIWRVVVQMASFLNNDSLIWSIIYEDKSATENIWPLAIAIVCLARMSCCLFMFEWFLCAPDNANGAAWVRAITQVYYWSWPSRFYANLLFWRSLDLMVSWYDNNLLMNRSSVIAMFVDYYTEMLWKLAPYLRFPCLTFYLVTCIECITTCACFKCH